MKKISIFLLISIYQFVHPAVAIADSINLEISGNGASSDSVIEANVEQEVTVSQTNQGEITNQVTNELNTGNNQVNDNTSSDIQVQTGDVASQVDINNQVNVNNQTIDTCCQASEINLSVVGNGSDAQNQISLASNQNVTSVASNSVVINNVIVTKANTGKNTINDNTVSQISLQTGDIHQESAITNVVNHTESDISTGQAGLVVIIKKNGSGSVNQISVTTQNDVNQITYNMSAIKNILLNDLNTGKNTINGNTAENIMLQTGDVFSFTTISNLVNNIKSKIDTCCNQTPAPPNDQDDDEDTDENPIIPDGKPDEHHDDNGGGGDGGSQDNGSGVGGPSGDVLPVTGVSNLILFANTLILLTGLMLRFKPWRALASSILLELTISY